MWIKRSEYERLKKYADAYNETLPDILALENVLGVATGCTVSYNMMRDLVEEMCKRFENLGGSRFALEYRQKKEHIDKIAWHNSVAKDACIGGYD